MTTSQPSTRQQRPRALVMRGLPGIGKSTLAKRLAASMRIDMAMLRVGMRKYRRRTGSGVMYVYVMPTPTTTSTEERKVRDAGA